MRKSTKIVLASLLAAVSALSLCSCASTNNTSTNDTAQTNAIEVVEETTVQDATTISVDESETEVEATQATTSEDEDTYDLTDEFTVEESSTMYETLKEYYNTDVMQETIKETEESLESDLYSAKILYEDNTLVYQYTLKETYADDEKEGMAETIESTVENASAAFETISDELNSIIIEPCTLKLRYLNSDGTTLYEREFT